MRTDHLFTSHYLRPSVSCVWIVTIMLTLPLHAEPTPLSQDTLLRARQVTVGILADTQDQRMPEKAGKVIIRGTGFHLREGYVITARHTAEKHELSTGTIVQKQIRLLTNDLHELPADLVGESTFMDVVLYRVVEQHRSKLQAGTSFASAEASSGMEVFTIGYPLGWGPTMAFGKIGNTNTFLQTVDTRLIQADLSTCSGNSGGGLFNPQGEIVGIVHAVIQTDQEETQAHCSRLTFVVPGTLAERIINAALLGKPLAFSRLGVHMTSIKDGTKLRVAVKDVAEPARSAGIQKHDILLAIEDTEILDAAQLKNFLIERTTPGQEVSVKVRRVDVDLTFHVVLGGEGSKAK
ncbi:MAG: S1C family serine protease [Nitrospira sp.]|nr:S1C family serine protease [Nitrospira sp.]